MLAQIHKEVVPILYIVEIAFFYDVHGFCLVIILVDVKNTKVFRVGHA